MSITPQLISLIISLVAVFFIFVSFVLGAIRGLKKSVFRLVWILAWGIVCLVFSGIIAKALVNVNISFLHLNVNGEAVSTLPEYIQKLISSSNPDVSQMMADNPRVFELCTQIAICVLNLFFFEVLFWVVKWLLYPIWAIFAAIIFKKNKTKKSKDENDVYVREKKPKKHAFFGALVGIGTGLIVAFFAFIPLAGISNAVLTLEAETTIEYDGATQKGVVSQYAGDYIEYIYVYEDSILNKVFKYTGIGTVQNLSSNILTTTTFEGKRINLQSEIKEVAPIYVDYSKITNYDFNNLSKQDLNEIIPIIDDLQQHTLSSGIVQSIYDEIVPYLIKNVLTKDDYFIQIPSVNNEILDNMIKNSVRAMFGITETNEIDKTRLIKIDNIKNDISIMLSIAKDINEADILLDIINNEASLENMQQKITAELGSGIVDKIFETTMVSRLTPVVVEPITQFVLEFVPEVEYNDEITKIEYSAVDGGVTNENVKEFMKAVTTNAIEVFKNIDTNSTTYVSADDFSRLGSILDKLKLGKVISRETFDSAINYLEVFGKKTLQASDLNNDLKEILNAVIDNVSGIGSYETELRYIGQAYTIYDDAESFDIEVGTKMLDKIKSTYIYTSSIDQLIDELTDYVVNYINDNDVPLATENLSTFVGSIKLVDSFESEYGKIKDFFDFVKEVGFENISSNENLATLGEKLDICISNGSVLLSNTNVKIIAKNFIEKLELPDDIKNINIDGQEIKEVIKSNVDNITLYKDEMEAIIELYEIKDITSTDKQKLVDIGEILDNVKSSKLLGNILSSVVSSYIDTELDKYTIDAQILPLIESIKNNISNDLIYKTEFGYMYDFMSADFDSLTNFKNFLSSNLINIDGTSKSELITTNTLYDIVIEMSDNIEITEIDIIADIKAQLELDKTNGENIVDVLDELENITTEFDDMKVIPAIADIDSAYFENLGAKIDNLTDNYPLVVSNSAKTKIGDYIASQINQKVQDDTSISQGNRDAVAQTYSTFMENREIYGGNYVELFNQFADDLALTND